jgi:hypothetical protein
MQVVQGSAHKKAALSTGIHEPNPALSSPCADYKVILSEMIDLTKEGNFFETRVIEYQTGGALSWD